MIASMSFVMGTPPSYTKIRPSGRSGRDETPVHRENPPYRAVRAQVPPPPPGGMNLAIYPGHRVHARATVDDARPQAVAYLVRRPSMAAV